MRPGCPTLLRPGALRYCGLALALPLTWLLLYRWPGSTADLALPLTWLYRWPGHTLPLTWPYPTA